MVHVKRMRMLVVGSAVDVTLDRLVVGSVGSEPKGGRAWVI